MVAVATTEVVTAVEVVVDTMTVEEAVVVEVRRDRLFSVKIRRRFIGAYCRCIVVG